eukprot:CAMPEP_0113854164 /NCGR_PEP_ID=MMETSP0372-20130328/7089_1 /TAXON_ID=340204 /ORGANISM="Lankesteria abbotti" /LENGTH=141 /DNA_ID=CAMNT_0000827145 /DNA_START=300 /DNA_END=725 /DNA_ORIENTATION=+ /assembly_acc=CAM_ASM_000359
MTIEVVGSLVIVLNIVLFSTPLAQVKSVVRSNSTESLPATIVTMMVFQNAVWTLYGSLLDAPVIYVPSIVCFEIVVFQGIVLLATATQSAVPFDIGFLKMLWASSDIVVPTQMTSVSLPMASTKHTPRNKTPNTTTQQISV